MNYIGACDKIRQTEEGEDFWQEMMKNKTEIDESLFLKYADLKDFLDFGETWKQYKDNYQKQDVLNYFHSIVNNQDVVFLQTCGFEFIWTT